MFLDTANMDRARASVKESKPTDEKRNILFTCYLHATRIDYLFYLVKLYHLKWNRKKCAAYLFEKLYLSVLDNYLKLIIIKILK